MDQCPVPSPPAGRALRGPLACAPQEGGWYRSKHRARRCASPCHAALGSSLCASVHRTQTGARLCLGSAQDLPGRGPVSRPGCLSHAGSPVSRKSRSNVWMMLTHSTYTRWPSPRCARSLEHMPTGGNAPPPLLSPAGCRNHYTLPRGSAICPPGSAVAQRTTIAV